MSFRPHKRRFREEQRQQPPQQEESPGDAILWIGNLQYWMDEFYLYSLFGSQTGEVTEVKVITNRETREHEGYGFVVFVSHAAAKRALQTYSNTLMPGSEQCFNLNWATISGASRANKEKGQDDYTIYVGNLAGDVSDYLLQETFKAHYPSVKDAKVVTDRITGFSKGYGFVRFADEAEQQQALEEMNGEVCSTRRMRVEPAKTKKHAGGQQY